MWLFGQMYGLVYPIVVVCVRIKQGKQWVTPDKDCVEEGF